ncbi:MAG: hypothetical protein HQM03_17610 [Magnetococcales bacterium]|nr:hypothetical protein [Magnetococcales bacterium]
MKNKHLSMILSGVLALSTAQGAWAGETPAAKAPGAGGEATQNKWSADPQQIAQRMDALSTLINKSSGAQKIAAAGNPEASAMRDQALAGLQEAKGAFDRKDYDGAKKLLTQASQTMFEAIRKADGGASEREKQAQDFDRRLASVKVLLDAHIRISGEKGRGQETNEAIRKAMDDAARLHQAGDTTNARLRLDEGYVTAKLGIEKLRRGDTLVRTLNFKNKEEEYHYEVDRNDTHQMLINMLLQNKGDAVKQMAEQFVKRARDLREQAEKQAAAGKFDAAVATMESATDELVKAIRGAGVYIPG